MTTQHDERAEFESHWYNKYHSGSITSRSDGSYIGNDVQKAWEAWQARAALLVADSRAGGEELPPLPEAKAIVRGPVSAFRDPEYGSLVDFDCEGPLAHNPEDGEALFTADQMEDYARAALLAAPQTDELRAKGWISFDCPVCGSDGAVAERPQADTNKQAALLPCPFCGEASDLAVHVYGNGEDDAYVQCRECTTCGPDGGDREGAIIKWNQRAAPKGEAVASIYISHHKAGENFDVDYWGSLPAGSHTLYTRPAPAEPQAVDAEWLERREQAAYEAGKQAVAQWQPIETAPKDGTAILVTDSFAYRSDPKKTLHHIYRAVYWDDESGWVIYNDGEIIDEDGPTYWMPLPAEPGATLSASPAAPAAPAEREPLTEQQVFDDDGIMEANADAGLDMARIMQFVRAIEAAHHIGKPKDVGINGLTEAETAASASVMGLTSKNKEQ